MCNTPHKSDCKMSFGRKDITCPRCQELLQGSPTRSSWHKNHFNNQAKRLAEIRAHDCVKSNCGPVCTAFDW